MRKIPNVFVRSEKNRSLVTRAVTPGCEWVMDGEGIASRKWDGTACYLDSSLQLFKRYSAKPGRVPPKGWYQCQDPDPTTGHHPGWAPITENDKWHIEALAQLLMHGIKHGTDRTYELCGPKVNGGPDGLVFHTLIPHGCAEWNFHMENRSYNALLGLLENSRTKMEGLVFTHPDGRMAKVKRKDFGLRWP